MEEKKITDEEMLEALRICTGADDCDVCPLEQVRDCTHKVLETAFDFIERLQEELDYYKCANRELTSTNKMLKRTPKANKQVKEENKFENKTWCNMIEDCPMAQQAVKDTAREIYSQALKWCPVATDGSYGKLIVGFTNWLKKEYGLEVE